MLHQHLSRRASSSCQNRSAFTLIELLVVIAIIAILAAILFPVFARARENARKSSCQSNMKQIGLAFMQYSQDYDESYPGAVNYGMAGTTSDNAVNYNVAWDVMIAPYLGIKVDPYKSPLIMQCPSDAKARQWNLSARSYSMPFRGGWVDNEGSTPDKAMMGGTLRTSTGVWMGRKLAEVPVPAETFLVVENPSYTNWWANNSGATCSGPKEQKSWDGTVIDAPTHLDGYNYLFTDGHVKWMRTERTLGISTDENAPRGYWTITEGD